MVTDSHSRLLGITTTHNTRNRIIQDTRSSAAERPPITPGPPLVQIRLRRLDRRILILQHQTSTACSIRVTNKGSMAESMGLVGEGCPRCTTFNIRTLTSLSTCNTTRVSSKTTRHTRRMARYLGITRATHRESCQTRRRASLLATFRTGIRRRHVGGRHNR